MDSRVIILLVASLLLAASVVFFVSSLLMARRARRVMLAPPPAAQAPPEDRRPASELLAGPLDLGGWVPPESRRDYPTRAVIPADELDARLAELSSAFEAAVAAASSPEPERPQAPVAAPEARPTLSQPVVPVPAPTPVPTVPEPAPAPAPPRPPTPTLEPAPVPSVSPELEPATRPMSPAIERTTAPTTSDEPAATPRHSPVPPMDLATMGFAAATAVDTGAEHAVTSKAPSPAEYPRVAEEPPAAPSVRGYEMVAPVELVFSDGGARVGIRPGTATFLKYQRLAAVLLSDLRKASSR